MQNNSENRKISKNNQKRNNLKKVLVNNRLRYYNGIS